MKHSRSAVRCKAHSIAKLKFENQSLTSFAGLVIFQKFFANLNLKSRLSRCFGGRQGGKVYAPSTIFLQLLIHILLGYRELRDCRYYRDDPLVKRILGMERLPDVATLSRILKKADPKSAENLKRTLRELIFKRLSVMNLSRVTLDFDGSVLSTCRMAQGTAVGYNGKKKGARSYYPLFCTIAQTGQVLDFLHRPGNVHDSNGAREFIIACIKEVREALPNAVIEVRMDSAFFSDKIISVLEGWRVEFSLSVPFERFPELKGMIEGRRRLQRSDDDISYFEISWKPKCWDRSLRFVIVRTRTKKQYKGVVQLDLFVPHESGYEFKVIVTNKLAQAKTVAAYHDGRGSQESIFGTLKSQCQMGYIPVRSKTGNQIYMLAALYAHNLNHELQMSISSPQRSTTRKRATLWVFERISTIRRTIIQRAGQFTRPQGKLTLTISGGEDIKQRVLQTLAKLQLAG